MSLRILHILDHSIPLHSGYTFRTLSILKHQRDLGWETYHLTSPKQVGVTAVEESVDGWHFYRTPTENDFRDRIPVLGELALMSALERRIEEVIEIVKPDIIHAHSPVLNAVPSLRVSRRHNIPIVYEVRAFWEDAAVDHGTSREWGLRYRASRALETWVFRRVGAITTICEGLRDDIVARGISKGKVTIIPNAVNYKLFDTSAEVDKKLRNELDLCDKQVLGFIGSFYAYEGLAILLKALPSILEKQPKLRLLLVGGGPDENNLKNLVAKLGLRSEVIFAGRVPHEQVLSYYDLVDILVYPRISMRLTDLVTPLKPLEAMARCRLVIASDVGGHRELIIDKKTGFLFRAGESESLANTVVELFKKQDTWPKVCQAARRFVEKERNWTDSVSRYQQVYNSVTMR